MQRNIARRHGWRLHISTTEIAAQFRQNKKRQEAVFIQYCAYIKPVSPALKLKLKIIRMSGT